MIIDYKNKISDCFAWDVLDAETGENINHLRIFYADDEAGLIRRYLKDSNGKPYAVGDEIAWTEEKRKIRIVPKPVPAR